ncbi:gallinacin-13-like [Hemicordylus capensis]|uniref:gallinacin-13-like n=1 Tax=Hemicordylus capensis TaxID=884348 RepID=UPI0023047BB5|nr:gallinacin-13-like [Hemicordylus capensis]
MMPMSFTPRGSFLRRLQPETIMRVLFLLWSLVLIFCQSMPGAVGDLYDSLECRNQHGHCRRLCFHNERPIGTCTNRRQLCCK